MESAICLPHCPFPFEGARPSRFHLRFNHAIPLCVRQISTIRHPVTRSVRPLNCMLERFSEPLQNEASGNKILRGVTVAGVSTVLACVVGLFNFCGKMNPKLTTAYATPRKVEIIDTSKVEAPGRSALKSLLDIIKRDAEQQYDRNEFPTKFSKLGPSPNEVNILKLVALGHSISEKQYEALKLLKEQYNKCKNNCPEAEHDLALALVEVSMCQEKFDEAREVLDEQIDKLLSEKKGATLTPKQVSEFHPQKCLYIWELYHLVNSDNNGLDESDNNVFDEIKIAHLILYKSGRAPWSASMSDRLQDRVELHAFVDRAWALSRAARDSVEAVGGRASVRHGPRPPHLRDSALRAIPAIVQTVIEDNEEGKWWKGNKEAREWRKLYINIFKDKKDEM
ncbi:hypothetical protein VNO78_10982 [Psophocarpus tetragonolobus]|uniref:Uncharacterized protein n=1 Tax=Psophocarpus tetragonolobus TaxID=3891 RepID=A0AAN9XN87_PSOTE